MLKLLLPAQVACLSNANAHLAVDPEDSFALQTKPHGHGDVHALLHSSGLLSSWRSSGVQWVAFFQDTNGLVFRALPAALGEGLCGGGGVGAHAQLCARVSRPSLAEQLSGSAGQRSWLIMTSECHYQYACMHVCVCARARAHDVGMLNPQIRCVQGACLNLTPAPCMCACAGACARCWHVEPLG